MTALLLALTLFASWAEAAAQQQSRLIAIVGITREIAPVEARLESATVTRIQGIVFTSATIDGTRIVTARSGAGKVNAALAAALLLDHFSPTALFFTGTAGAIDPDLNPADVVIGTAVGYHDFGDVTARGFNRTPTRNTATGRLDPAFFPADPNLLAAARRAAGNVKPSRGPAPETSPVPRIREGLIVTGDAFIANPTRRTELRRDLNASAVEMEGAAVAQVCARFGVPVIVIRSITDHADSDAEGSYQRFVDTAARNAADLALATIHEFLR